LIAVARERETTSMPPLGMAFSRPKADIVQWAFPTRPLWAYNLNVMTTKTTDSKGRLTLGERFANRTVIVEEIDDTAVRITLARVVPEREMWLHENRAAAAAVSRGLAEARAGKLSSLGPDLAADAALADTLQD
jgi:hypothetical protein